MQLKFFYSLLFLSLELSCNLNGKVTGKYHNENGDKLEIKKNERYYFSENLTTQTRKTYGHWLYFGTRPNQIRFYCYQEKADYTFEVFIQKSETKYNEIKVYLANTDTIIPMYWAKSITNKDTSALWPLHTSFMNQIGFEEKIDTAILSMQDYRDLTFKLSDTGKNIYSIRLFPTEPIYKFDNPTYKFSKNKLTPLGPDSALQRLWFKKKGA